MANTLPNVPVHAGSKFLWSGRLGAAEVSDFNAATLAGRLYADACDVGFYVESPRTGKRVLFSEEDVERREGEIVSWRYSSEEGFRIIVWND